MAFRIFDRVQQTTTGTGTGALSLTGSVAGMQTFAGAGYANADTFPGLVENAAAPAEWELAICTYNAGAIARTTLLKSSTGAAVNFSAGTKTVTVVSPASLAMLLGTLEAVAAPTITAGVLNLDMLAATVHKVALNANITTLNFLNALAGVASSFTVEFTADGTLRTVTLPGSVVALNGSYAPSSTNGKRDLLNFVTLDGGTTWLMAIVAQNY